MSKNELEKILTPIPRTVKRAPSFGSEPCPEDPPAITAHALSPGCRKLHVNADESGLRLDQYLAGRCPDLSRGMARRLIELGGVHASGRRMRQCSRAVAVGELIELFIDGMPLEPYRVLAQDVLWRDPYLLALNKPAGVETQPTPARYRGTLYAALLEFLHNPDRPHVEPQLGMVQRLDRETSGVIVFSIHQRAHRGLTEIFAGRQASKRYLAIVAGRPAQDQAEIVSSLARGRDNRVRSVARGGREAVTRYRVVQRLRGATLLEVEILTGRSHQIRVHMAEAGHPLLGDLRYGGPAVFAGVPIQRQMLHSAVLEFCHPVTAATLQIAAPLPVDMTEVLKHLSLQPDLDESR